MRRSNLELKIDGKYQGKMSFIFKRIRFFSREIV